MSNEKVNHPTHYNQLEGVECIDIVEGMGFLLGNFVKYIYRAPHKGNPEEDLAKARWYLDRIASKKDPVACFIINDKTYFTIKKAADEVYETCGSLPAYVSPFLKMLLVIAESGLTFPQSDDILRPLYDNLEKMEEILKNG